MRRSFLFVVSLLLCVCGMRTSAESFKNPRLIATGSDPVAVATADFNADGKPDLVYLDLPTNPYIFTLHVLLSDGEAGFRETATIRLPPYIGGAITAGDVNGDGKTDLILGSRGPSAEVATFLGNGDGTFGPAILSVIPTQVGYWGDASNGVAVADFDGDGIMDLFVPATTVSYYSAVYVMRGNNTGSFAVDIEVPSLFSNVTLVQPVVGDFNGDGHLDFIAHNTVGNRQSVYLADGHGGFAPGVQYGELSNGYVVADVDGDGHPDMIVCDFQNRAQVLWGKADGTFIPGSYTTFPSNEFPLPLAAADFNGDGAVEIVVVSDRGMSILTGSRSAGFVRGPVVPPGATFTSSVSVADFNVDGRYDFAVAVPGGLALLPQKPDGSFETFDSYEVGGSITGIAVADFTGDHVSDIAVGVESAPLSLLRGLGDGTFAPAPSSPPQVAKSLAAGDFNGDGNIDLFDYRQEPAAGRVLFGDGRGGFPAEAITNFGLVADFNGDGKSDIVSPQLGIGLNTYLGQANNSALRMMASALPDIEWAHGATAGDFNRDGRLDLATTGNAVHIWLGKGDGTFAAGRVLWTYALPSEGVGLPWAIGRADFDGDGQLDLIVSGGGDNLAEIFYGRGDGAFDGPLLVHLTRSCLNMAVADLNGDGKPDFVCSGDRLVSVIHNHGNRSFGSEAYYLAGANPADLHVQDVNADGFPDIVVGNPKTSTVAVLLSQPALKVVRGELHVSPDPSQHGELPTLRLSLAPLVAEGVEPTGEVLFSVDGQLAASVELTEGEASYTCAALDVGAHTITARYSGDTNFAVAIFSVPHNVVPLVLNTTTVLTATPQTLLTSQTVRLVATVSTGEGTTPTGAVAFHDGGTNMGTVALDDNGAAAFNTALLKSGTHAITAWYLGNERPLGVDTGFAASTSAPVTVVVNVNATQTTLSARPASAATGATVTLTASVESSGDTPTGAVSFYEGGVRLQTLALDARGVAAHSVTFSTAGTHSLTAVYEANATFAGSLSAPQDVVISSASQGRPTNTRLSATTQTTAEGRLTTLIAAVSATGFLPAGWVVFRDGRTEIGSAWISQAGTAIRTIPSLTPGLHYLTAQYLGDAKFAASMSPVLVEDPSSNGTDFVVQLSSPAASVPWGQPASLDVWVAPVGDFRGEVALGCSGSSPGVFCSFQPPAIPGGQGKSRLTVVIAAPVLARSSPSLWRGALVGLPLCCLAVALIPWRRRRSTLVTILGLSALIAGWGCGFSRTPQPAANYIVTVTARAVAGEGVHSVQVKLALH